MIWGLLRNIEVGTGPKVPQQVAHGMKQSGNPWLIQQCCDQCVWFDIVDLAILDLLDRSVTGEP